MKNALLPTTFVNTNMLKYTTVFFKNNEPKCNIFKRRHFRILVPYITVSD